MSETLSRDLLDQTASELVEALAARKVSALELTEAVIVRIETRDPAINAVVVRDFDRAREAAKAADAALARGERRPLLGLPMTVKESHAVAGLPSTWGSDGLRGYVSPEDSIAVARLKAAGAVILGKTNIPPMLADYQAANSIYGRTNNPWDPTRSPGGSSGGGAAALAAGMVPLEFGSDLGGSIRVPAAFCGVYGHKPSYGLVPARGHAPGGAQGSPLPLAVVGPLARSAVDLARALEVTAGPDEPDSKAYSLNLPPPRHERLDAYRVLVVEDAGAALDSEIRAAVGELAARLEETGAHVARESDLLPDYEMMSELFRDLVTTAMSRGVPGSPSMSAHEWISRLDAQLALRKKWGRLFRDFDVVVTPVFTTVAFPHDDNPRMDQRSLLIDGARRPFFAQPWVGPPLVANLPATAFPAGFTRGGLPIGLQAIGPYLEDRTTIAFAGLVEREFGGFRAPPPL